MLYRLNHQPYLLLVATTLFWGGNAVGGSLAAGHIGPLSLTCLRWGLATLLLLPFAWPHLRRDWPRIRESWMFLAVMGAVGFAAFNSFLYTALKYTPATNVAIEQTAMPMLILLLNRVLFSQAMGAFQVVGVLLSVAGALITVTHGHPAALLNLDINPGDALMGGAVLSYAAYSVFLRRKPDIHLLAFMLVLFASAFVVMLPLLVWEMWVSGGFLMDATGMSVLLYAAIFPAIFGQLFFVRAVELIGANRAGVFINLVPLFAAGLAWLLLGDTVVAFQLVGYVLVVSGICCAQRRPITES